MVTTPMTMPPDYPTAYAGNHIARSLCAVVPVQVVNGRTLWLSAVEDDDEDQ